MRIEELAAEIQSLPPETRRKLLQIVDPQSERLADSVDRLREILDGMPVAVYTTDADGRLDYYNQACVELSGRVPEVGSDRWGIFWKLFGPDQQPLSPEECPMAIALREGRIVRGAEALIEHPDGKQVWVVPYPGLLRDASGKVTGGINVLVDITERKRAELATARLAAIVDSSDDAIVSKDLKGIIRSWNLGAQRLFGYSADEVIGKSVTLLIPDDRLDEENTILDSLAHGRTIDHYETVRLRKDGTPLDVSLTVSPVKDPTGRIVGAAKIARNISERKRAERERERLLNEARVARASAEEANEAKTAFLANMSHELRTPLNAIVGYADLLKEEIEGPLNAGQKRQLERIEVGARHLLQIVEEILTFSRIEAGHEEIELEMVDLSGLIEEMAALIEPLAGAKGLEFACDAPDDIQVVTDPRRVRQILLNLLSNAVKFTDKGGIRLELRRESERIIIRVCDTGIGIPSTHLTRIFEPFAQVEQTAARRAGGTGLGLSVTARLAELLEGSMTVESTPGKGSVFTIQLPYHDRGRKTA